MRSSFVALLGLVPAVGCGRTSPTAPAETDLSFSKHEITHIDDRGGTFELRGLEDCFGELVVVTGTLRYKEHTMTSLETGNQDHTAFTFFESGTAVAHQQHDDQHGRRGPDIWTSWFAVISRGTQQISLGNLHWCQRETLRSSNSGL